MCSTNGTRSLEENDDMLMEILVRLPPKSIFKCTCVSTRWNNLVMNPIFFKLYSERERKSGFKLLGIVQCYMKTQPFEYRSLWKQTVMSATSENLRSNGGNCFFLPKCRALITSSNSGFFLCGSNLSFKPSKYDSFEDHIGNPITKRWETLPLPPLRRFPERYIFVGLACKEEEVRRSGSNINFRVIVATGTEANYLHTGVKTIPIQTYSSRSGKWRSSKLTCAKPVTLDPKLGPTVSGSLFHWFTLQGDIVVFDSSSLDEEDNDYIDRVMTKKEHVAQVIKLPHDICSKVIWRSNDGQTMWYGVSNHRDGLEIYERRDDSRDWTLVSKVGDMDRVRTDLMRITSNDIRMEMEKCRAARRAIDPEIGEMDDDDVRLERDLVRMIVFIPQDPKLVLVRLWERIYIYDWQNQMMDQVQLKGRASFTLNMAGGLGSLLPSPLSVAV